MAHRRRPAKFQRSTEEFQRSSATTPATLHRNTGDSGDDASQQRRPRRCCIETPVAPATMHSNNKNSGDAASQHRRLRCPTTAAALPYNLVGASLQPRRSSKNRRGSSLQPRRSFIATSAVLHGSTPTAAGEASLQRCNTGARAEQTPVCCLAAPARPCRSTSESQRRWHSSQRRRCVAAPAVVANNHRVSAPRVDLEQQQQVKLGKQATASSTRTEAMAMCAGTKGIQRRGFCGDKAGRNQQMEEKETKGD